MTSYGLQQRFIPSTASARGTRRLAGLLACAALALAAAGGPGSAQAAPLDTLVKAVKFDDVSQVNKSLAEGLDPNSVDDYGYPLLTIAAREKSDKVAQVLLDNPHTDPNKQDSAGENAMMLAALNHDATLVKLLIAKEADVNKKGWTPLHYAASVGDDAIVKILLDESAYIDAGSPNGTTPLMMAARGGHVSTAQLLVNEGADPAIKNQIGLTALDFAVRYNEKDAAEWLKDSAPAAAVAARGKPPASGVQAAAPR